MRAYVAIALLALLIVADGAGVLSMIAQHKLGRVATRLVPLEKGLQGLQTETTLALVFHGLNIIAAMLALSVVWRIHKLQTRQSCRLTTADARSVPAE